MKEIKKKTKDKRGKWSRIKWIRILKLFSEMPIEERKRCLRATVEFFNF